MLSNIRLSKNLQIYRKKESISKQILKNIIFPTLVKNKTKKKRAKYLFIPIIKAKSKNYQNIYYSIMAFKFEEEPSFLENSFEKEVKYAYLCIIEDDEHIYISKKNLNNVEKELSRYINNFSYEKFSCFKGNDSTKYEKISMANMTISNSVIRARSYEANNLNGIIPMSSSSRSVPRNIKINYYGDVFSITPNTSRIGQRSKKSNIEEYISWCILISIEIHQETSSKFIKEFAKPITLEEIINVNNSKPIGILFHFHELEEKIEDGNNLYIFENNTLSILCNEKIKKLFSRLKNMFKIKYNQTSEKYEITNGRISFSELKVNDKSVSIKNPVFNNIYLDNQKEESILNFINDNKNYTIVFDKPEYAYIGKYAFSDEQLLSRINIDRILSIFDTNHTLLDLGDIESEKCKPSIRASQSEKDAFNLLNRFPKKSLFYRVEEYFNKGVLICDDMGNEWADHININEDTISFIHSKFTKKDTYGASAMHEVVSQALKNIGRVHASIDEYKNNFDSKWKNTYQSTNIPRATKDGNIVSNFDEIKESLEQIYSNPNSKRQIYLATPFFSKSEITTKLNNLVVNGSPNPHYIQLVWLLSSFISSCVDYGIEPYILCKE